jgi:hypothetical protein
MRLVGLVLNVLVFFGSWTIRVAPADGQPFKTERVRGRRRAESRVAQLGAVLVGSGDAALSPPHAPPRGA